jgi:uncharacterized protein (DUF2141 family)
MRYSILMLLAGASVQAATLTVEVSNFQSEAGSVNVAVYTGKGTWLKPDLAVASQSIDVSQAISTGTVSIDFELEPGEYAAVVHHDDNDNGKMDTNFVGIPKEPTGASNGEVNRFGPPRYPNAAFTLGENGLRMPIRLSD